MPHTCQPVKKLLTAALASKLRRWRDAASDESDRRDRLDTEGCVWGWGCPCTPWREPFRGRAAHAKSRRGRGVTCQHQTYEAPGFGHGWWCIDDIDAGPEPSLVEVARVTGRDLYPKNWLTVAMFRGLPSRRVGRVR